MPSDLLVDDGYLLYTVETQTTEDGLATTWSLNARFRLYTRAPDRSLLKMRIARARGGLQDVMCDFRPNTDDGPDYIVTANCGDPTLQFSGPGKLTVEWHYLNGATDVHTHLRTHTIQVVEARRVGPDMARSAPEYVVDRHAELLSTILWPRGAGGSAYVEPVDPALAPGEPTLEVLMNHSPAGPDVPTNTQMRCQVNGLPIPLGGEAAEAGPVTVYPGEYRQATYRRAPKRKETEAYEETLAFRQLLLRLPVGHGTGDGTLQTLQAHRGSWVCTWETAEGDPLRVFRWIVHDDGAMSPHAEQFDNLTLAPGAYLVHTEAPRGNTLDARTSPDRVRSQAFHGRGYRTRDGKDAARMVPKAGRPGLPRR